VLEIAEIVWKLVKKDRFSELKDLTLKLHSMFGNTYVCESTFSTMKQVKSINKIRMVDEIPDDSVRLAPLTQIFMKE